jgi:hypothetical protein
VYGPGHDGFFQSPDGSEDWIVYHANPSSSQSRGTARTTRIQKTTWNADGSPNLGVPVATGTAQTVPSGEPVVTYYRPAGPGGVGSLHEDLRTRSSNPALSLRPGSSR